LKSQVFDSLRRFSSHPLFRGLEFLESSVKTPAGGYAIGLSVDEAWKLEGSTDAQIRQQWFARH
jgi:hypothetical protein